MAIDKMFDLAFQFEETRLWKKLSMVNLFAVQLPDSQIGYCCVSELGKEYCFSLFTGDDGYFAYRRRAEQAPEGVDRFDASVGNVFYCLFKNNNEISKEIREKIYQTIQHSKWVDQRVYPVFTELKSEYKSAQVNSVIRNKNMCAAFSAAIALNKELADHRKTEFGFLDTLPKYLKNVPYLYLDENNWKIGTTALPQGEIPWFSSPVFHNEMLAKKVRNTEKSGSWECRVIRLDESKQTIGNKGVVTLYYPLMLYVVDRIRKTILPLIFQNRADVDEEGMLMTFVEHHLLRDCPEVIYVGNKRTYFFLKDLCAKTGIELKLKNTPVMDKLLSDTYNKLMITVQDYLSTDDSGEIEKSVHFATLLLPVLTQFLSTADKKKILSMPKYMFQDVRDMYQLGFFPDDVSEKLHQMFKDW